MWEPNVGCTGRLRWLWFFLGLAPERELWGERAIDMGCFLRDVQRKDWYDHSTGDDHGDHHAVHTWFNTPFYKRPAVRHHWGEPQQPLHTGATDLFLDLIFVGVAFRVGVVLKAAFYACDPDLAFASGGGSGSGSGSGSVSGSGSASGSVTAEPYGRMLGSGSGGSDVACVGFSVGLAYALAPYVCIYLLWSIEREYKASFAITSKVHYCLELLCSLCLVLASMSIDTVASYRGVPRAEALVICLGLLILDLFIWIVRLLELALTNAYEGPRRQASFQVVVALQTFACWLVGWVLISLHVADPHQNALLCDVCVGLMWLGCMRWQLSTYQRPLRLLLLPGPHPIIERTFVVSNMGFQFHRNNEFMFLMLGETVLQIVVATSGRSETEGVQDGKVLGGVKLTAAMSFLLAVEMMYCFTSMVAHQIAFYNGNNTRIESDKEEEAKLLSTFEATAAEGSVVRRTARERRMSKEAPEGTPAAPAAAMGGGASGDGPSGDGGSGGGSGGGGLFFTLVKQQQATARLASRHLKAVAHEAVAQPLLSRAKVWTAVQQTIWQAMAIAIMLVGVGVKLAIYDPFSDPNAHFALALRLMIGVSVSVVFALQLFYAMVIRRRQHYRKPLELLRTQPAHAVLVALQLAALVAQSVLALLPLAPVAHISCQAGTGLVQCVLLHIHEHRLPATSSEIHPLAGVPDCLEAIRLKASKYRMNDKYSVDLQRIIRLQSIGRARLARASTKMLKTSKALG